MSICNDLVPAAHQVRRGLASYVPQHKPHAVVSAASEKWPPPAPHRAGGGARALRWHRRCPWHRTTCRARAT